MKHLKFGFQVLCWLAAGFLFNLAFWGIVGLFASALAKCIVVTVLIFLCTSGAHKAFAIYEKKVLDKDRQDMVT